MQVHGTTAGLRGNSRNKGDNRKMQVRSSAKASRRPKLATPCNAKAPASTGAGRSAPDNIAEMLDQLPRELGSDPFLWTPHLAGLFDRQIMIAPLVMLWKYQIRDLTRFCDWLAARDIVLNDQRLGRDARLAGIRYCGTYVSGSSIGSGRAQCTTIWGYATREAMMAMEELCANRFATKTIVQSDLFEFVVGLREFLADHRDGGIVQEILVSSAAEPGRDSGG